jgi:hypothetical protein
MPTQLPILDSPFFDVLVDLGETTYLTTYRWNGREAAWYFDLAKQDGTMIVSGQKLVPSNSPSIRWAAAAMPTGMLFVYAQSPNTRPTLKSLINGEVQVWYYSSEEL